MSVRERLAKVWAWRRKLTRRIVWDLLMVYLAVINLGLILFDLTYLWLRPVYFRALPVVTRVYDPVKGIQPHPLIDSYLAATDEVGARLRAGTPPEELAGLLGEIRRLTTGLREAELFERSGQKRSYIRLEVAASRHLESEPGGLPAVLSAPELFDRFWSLTPDPGLLPERSRVFDSELRPLLALNYLRDFDLSGKLTDYFWLLDLPFLALFTVEFGVRWILAVRRSTYARWFLFPIFNWYDLLGIIPLRQFRLFRLFRIASIYVRLHRSEHTVVGDDIVSRTVRYFANIISEEISDMVSLRILNETQEEIREGTHRRIIRTVLDRHREALSQQLAAQARDLLTSAAVREQARGFLDANLERAVDSAEALRRLPLPDAWLRPLVAAIGQAVFDAIADTLAATLTSPEGRRRLESILADSLDGLASELTEGELDELVSEITLEVLEHIKEAVAVRKWALPDQPQRKIFTREVDGR